MDIPASKRFSAIGSEYNNGISVVKRENSINATEKSDPMTEYRLYAGISPDPDITDV